MSTHWRGSPPIAPASTGHASPPRWATRRCSTKRPSSSSGTLSIPSSRRFSMDAAAEPDEVAGAVGEDARGPILALREEVGKVVVGQEGTLSGLVAALL